MVACWCSLSSLLLTCLLQVIPRDSLPVQALARVEFGEHLLSVLGLADTVTLQVAKNLPPALLARGHGGAGGGDGPANANAFRNTYLWDAGIGVLYVHGEDTIFAETNSSHRAAQTSSIVRRRTCPSLYRIP